MKKSSIAKKVSRVGEDKVIKLSSFHSTSGSGRASASSKKSDVSKVPNTINSFHAMGKGLATKPKATMLKNKSGNSFRG